MTSKHIIPIVHIITRMVIHSLICVLNFLLPGWKPNFAKAARTQDRLIGSASADVTPKRLNRFQ